MHDGEIGFDIGRYDTSKPLVIDPTIVYHQRLSLSGWQKAGVAVRALAGASR